MQTHKQKTAFQAQKVTGTFEKQAPDPTTLVWREIWGVALHIQLYI